jgi:hypothetical protein
MNKQVKKKKYEQMQCWLKILCVRLNKNEIILQVFLLKIGNNIKKQTFDEFFIFIIYKFILFIIYFYNIILFFLVIFFSSAFFLGTFFPNIIFLGVTCWTTCNTCLCLCVFSKQLCRLSAMRWLIYATLILWKYTDEEPIFLIE